MDILKRSLAPITDEAWGEIQEQAKKTLTSTLTARKFVDVVGPKGWDYTVVPTGRLTIPEHQAKDGVKYGIYQVQPLIETRVPFELDIWELDNIVRGARDIELQPLIDAARKAALFEEHAIYHGFKEGAIAGLVASIEHKAIPAGDNPGGFLQALVKGVAMLTQSSVGGPYALVVNPELWAAMSGSIQGYPLTKRVQNIIDGPTIPCPAIQDAFLVSLRGGDLELIIGQDFSIGYEAHDGKKVKLFLTESFTFRVLDPSVLLRLNK
ncbi:linocin_M18 bacteriocin protein [Candidatus Vecturithrix granuli]|uniref:Linocin_M18 bacteriocin protein n=1 Tax=Vecturithrix granuli TaxID=1499967 RepID=A0A081C115_VECG1|nr:linocin_M18 bacteriocin protein [Candidatus Vecturithrix granuli]